ncbi:helix-turn-helix domain-containing protein [Microbacterium gilvum]|uniref:HTH cro/C1-type domain-containing protein n=1 Tax=Microbacterium gilvum TaxID=1336204 RepID=A0ABP9AQS4_9MICO
MVRRNELIDAAWRAYVQRLATTLRRARDRSGLSQEEVAYRAGLTRYTYQKYEKGESRPGMPANPSLRSLLALSQVLEVPLTDLVPGDVPDLRNR